ncbi:MAG: hypothetical protein OXC09_00220 [Truepera sp.]|nr:hypothetical protein [Truepera sp.]
MPRIVKGGLVRASTPSDTDLGTIKQARVDKHISLIEEAGRQGVQVLCLQETFCGPYLCTSQDSRWNDTAESIPDGPIAQMMMELAKRHGMVLVVPVYEQELTGAYYHTAAVIDADGSYLGKYRKTQIPLRSGLYERFSFRSGSLGYPVFETAVGNIGIYICHDRHLPEGARALELSSAEIVFNPSAVAAGLPEHLWRPEQPAHAVSNGYFVGVINRVGHEQSWDTSKFHGLSYFVNPGGKIVAVGSRDQDELITADLNLESIQEVRDLWQFYHDRCPELHDGW